MESMSPHEAVNEYLADKQSEVVNSTFHNHKHRLNVFLEWCEENGLEDMNNVRGRHLHEFKKWRAQDIKRVTLNNQLGTVRQFLQFCERLDVAPMGINERLALPDLDREDEVRETIVSDEEAEHILEYCERFEYATFRHALFYILWHTGMRISSLHALDIDDYNAREGWLDVRHRPDRGTGLKNKSRGERQVNLNEGVCEVIDDYIEGNHPYVEDDYGRMPLLGSKQGRPHRNTLTQNIYVLTRPCHYTNECPHGRSRDSCDATSNQHASTCPSSVSPHAIRRGSITAHRNANVPKEVASDRMDVSGDVLDKHYDMASPGEKRKRRQEHLDQM
ncbi:tyrosine-type recombinase/integrase [Halolamina sp. CBA1230]|uniref:tyrosine-type recombinase/integrase n=1 Tax=Halolamina sp. CBA1230 TaxID=1853690 RepID=UPI0020D1E7A7|nr:tyrosine-type recombinase/integrase [Halolamina sp. CBA1230]